MNDEGMIRVALQPDGVFHLVTGHDWLRSFCGLQLRPHETRYWPVHSYGSEPNHCSRCAAILDQRPRFPQSSNEELKPVLERIAKLFALSESPNENEAAAALARANKLLEKYNLTRGVVTDAAQQKAEKGMTDSLGAQVQAYKYTLVRATAYLHDVEWYRESHRRPTALWQRTAYDKHIVFVGLSANVATALVTFPYLVATAEAFSRAVRRERFEASWMGDYKQGFADRIWTRVSEHKRAARSHPGAAELIRVGTEIARNAMQIEDLFLGGSFSFGRGVGDSEAYQRGYQDGARVDLHGAQANRMLNEG
jgi:hypothetical protein